VSPIRGGLATVYVSDLAASLEFYVEKLGLEVAGGGDAATTVTAGTFAVSLHVATPAAPRPGTSGAIAVGFAVAKPIEQAVEELRARGVWFRGGIIEAAGVKRAFFGDPDGNDLFLYEAR